MEVVAALSEQLESKHDTLILAIFIEQADRTFQDSRVLFMENRQKGWVIIIGNNYRILEVTI